MIGNVFIHNLVKYNRSLSYLFGVDRAQTRIIFPYFKVRLLSSSEAKESILTKQRAAIGPIIIGFLFSVCLTRQINVQTAVCDTSDRLIIHFLFHRCARSRVSHNHVAGLHVDVK